MLDSPSTLRVGMTLPWAVPPRNPHTSSEPCDYTHIVFERSSVNGWEQSTILFCSGNSTYTVEVQEILFFFLQSPLILILTFDLNLICLTVVVVFLSLWLQIAVWGLVLLAICNCYGAPLFGFGFITGRWWYFEVLLHQYAQVKSLISEFEIEFNIYCQWRSPVKLGICQHWEWHLKQYSDIDDIQDSFSWIS